MIQLVGIMGAVVFVQLVFADEPHRLTWKMRGAQQAGNAVLPTAGSTAVGYWTLSSVGWGAARFAERAAVMIIAPAVPNFVVIIVLGLAMGLGLFAGPGDWWLTWLPRRGRAPCRSGGDLNAWRFLAWNAAGGIVWATLVALIAYYLGDAAAKAIGRYGLYAAGGAVLFAAIGLLIVRRIERRVVEEDT